VSLCSTQKYREQLIKNIENNLFAIDIRIICLFVRYKDKKACYITIYNI